MANIKLVIIGQRHTNDFMAKFNNNKKFDIDLKYGQVREKRLANIIENKKIEVKTERDWWRKTGNIAIEIESYGKPSGLKSTKADYWVHILADGKEDYCMLLFTVPALKKLASKYKNKWRMMGDNKASKCILIPLKEIFNDNKTS